ncbi:hypothetical protein EB73_34110 [Mycobacterium sp. SWH-M3]|nr:hypothetical protein EB73_34110 [Mycobacterium sp. SWH-M3]
MAKGISTRGDILVSKTADGVDLNDIFAEVQQVMESYNAQRSAITNLLCFRTTHVADAVPQSFTSESLEEETEFGIARAIRPPTDYATVAYNFRDYGTALRSSWQFLRDATYEQVRAGVTLALEADNKKTTGTIFNRLFNPTVYTTTNQGEVRNCYGLWNGDGSMKIPPYMGNTFTNDHNHYLYTGTATLDSNHIEQLLVHVNEHGYGVNVGTKMLILLNSADFKTSRISSWRAGEQYRTSGPLPEWDFIPSAILPARISNELIHGPIPDVEYYGLPVQGSYGGAYVIKSDYVPRNYVAVVASGGPNSDVNPIGFREHPNPEYQGFLHIPGPGPYPIQNSNFVRSFGVGVRHRGAAVVAQVTTDTFYTPPAPGVIPV